MTGPATVPAAGPPPRPRVFGVLFRRPDVRGRWALAFRSGLTLALSASLLYAIGFGTESLFAALGAFAVTYGERRPYRIRWKVITFAGAVLVAVSAVFSWIGHLAGPDPSMLVDLAVVGALALLTALTVFVANALRLGPPGPFFFLLVAGIVQLIARHNIAVSDLVIGTAVGAGMSLIVGMAPALFRPQGPEKAATQAALAATERFLAKNADAAPASRHSVALSTLNAWSVLHDAASTDSDLAKDLWDTHQRMYGTEDHTFVAPLPRPSILRRLRFSARLDSHATLSTYRATVAAAIAGSISVLSGLGRPDWAILGAALVLQLGPDRVHGTLRGTQRVIGTIVGVGVYAVLHLLDLHSLALIAVLAILNILIELTIASNYAVAVTFITPLALLIGGPATPLAVQVVERIVETSIGVAVAIALAWTLAPRMHRRTSMSADAISLNAGRQLITDAATVPIGDPRMRSDRRDLQWHLLEAEFAVTDSASDEPGWARDYWPEHLRVRDIGYDTLDACWRTPYGASLSAQSRQSLSQRINTASDQ